MSKREGTWALLVPDEEVERLIHIVGGMSAAASAKAERDRRREAGEDAHIFSTGTMLLVGPMPESRREAAQ